MNSEGLYRCGRRLQKSNIMYDTKHPVILPNDHRVTELINLEGHVRVFHNGLSDIFSQIRSQVWLIKG